MNYTLFIDESGDFENPKGEWIISGVLFSTDFKNCEKYLKSVLNSTPAQYGLDSIKRFHLTEFRKN